MKPLVRRFVFRVRPLSWFFRRNWYALRWNQNGCFHGERLYLVDAGAITFGWSYEYPANNVNHMTS